MTAVKIIVGFLFYLNCCAQLQQVTFKDLDAAIIDKPSLIFIHTQWCKSCISMSNKTFTDQALIKELNQNYNFISFDAELKKPITFNGITYSYRKGKNRKGIHELVEFLGTYKHKISYPTLVFLNTKKEVVFKSISKLNAKGVLKLLKDLKKHEKI